MANYDFVDAPTEGPTTFTEKDAGGNNNFIYGFKGEFSGEPGGEVPNFHTSFVSLNVPVWGDFWAKDGGGNGGTNAIFAHNAGFGVMSEGSSDFTDWTVRPDGDLGGVILPVSLPAAAWMGMITLGGLMAAKKAKNRLTT